ncbi:MAG: copper amine oxidase [Clostridiales bacterium]|nr:copper amine oxidase [Clostridiales bacterium]
MKKIFILILSVCMALAMCVPIFALNADMVNISYDGKILYEEKPWLVGGATYIPFREFFSKITNSEIRWDAESQTAAAEVNGLIVSAKMNDAYIIANGRYLYTGNKNLVLNGTMYVPVRPVAKAIGANVAWNGSKRLASLQKAGAFIEPGSTYYNENDVYWLARIIHAESNGELLLGKIAVGNVVLNRVRSSQYPNTIKEVIFDDKFGIQFSPVANGTIYNTPSAESVIAAKICLDGYSMNTDMLFFLNIKTASSLWIVENCTYVMKIGNHSFYA